MTIQQLRYVIEIDRQGSINAASASLFTTQPTISTAVKELEKELGYKIFLRYSKGITLTSKGQEFIRHAKKIVADFEQLNCLFQDKERNCKLSLRIASQHYAFLSEAFVEFLNEHNYDSYNFIIKEAKSLEVIEDVCQRKSDIAFIVKTDYNESILKEIFHKKGIIFHKLINPQPHIFLNKNHPLSNQKSIIFSQLEPYPAIIFDQDGNGLLSEELIYQKKLDKVIFVNDRATLIGILANCNAYNIGTGYLSNEMVKAGMLAIPLENDFPLHEIGWIHQAKYEPCDKALEFVKIVKRLLNAKL